jgi:hypothetical protein
MEMDIWQPIKERFDAEVIEIPFPYSSLYTESDTEPFPIWIVQDNPSTGPNPIKSQPAHPPQKAENHAD